MSDHEDIRALIARQEVATRAGDAAGVIACFTDDAVTFELPPPLVQPTAVVRDPAVLEAWFATWAEPPTITSRGWTVEVDGNLATAFGLRRMAGTQGGEAKALWYRETLVLRRTAAGWRIRHSHASVPFAMDGSDKALLDLVPEDGA